MTDCIMKHSHSRRTAIIPIVAVAFSLSSCIYEAPGDKFYRTLWSTSEVPLGPIDVDELTLEFLCGNKVTIKDGNNIIIAYGRYDPDGRTAVFTDIVATIDDIAITFLEAHLDDDVLFLLWRPDDMFYPFTTALTRKIPS